MTRLAVAIVAAALAASAPAAADPTPALAAPARASAPAPAPAGVAVVALGGAAGAAWPLAQEVYATPSLRPWGVDEAHARVLCGEAPPAGAPAELRDLADMLAAVRGDDAASRALLGDVARRMHVRALIVVRDQDGRATVSSAPAALAGGQATVSSAPAAPAGGRATARAFLADAGAFDAATYGPDDGLAGVGTPSERAGDSPGLAWTGAVRSLARAFGAPAATGPGAPAAPLSAPPLATHEEPALVVEPPTKKPFYESGWFWGALGAAAFAGGAVYFATRDNGPATIHLEMQVPR